MKKHLFLLTAFFLFAKTVNASEKLFVNVYEQKGEKPCIVASTQTIKEKKIISHILTKYKNEKPLFLSKTIGDNYCNLGIQPKMPDEIKQLLKKKIEKYKEKKCTKKVEDKP